MELWVHEKNQEQTVLGYKVKSVLHTSQSPYQSISIVDTVAMGKMLLLDGMVMTNEVDEFIYHELITHIPMLAHPNPETVLVIGGGDGGTIREVLKHPSVKKAVLCEIDGAVVDVCKQYLPSISCALDDPRVDIQIQDGAAFIANNPSAFDVILIDSTDPVGPGERLFTESFYQHVLAALTEQGVMANQSESPIAVPAECTRINTLLKGIFPVVQPYTACVPSYPGAQWSWTFCSKGLKPLEAINPVRLEALVPTCKYLNAETHRAVFALPNYMQALFTSSRKSSELSALC
jgi:spermidine synthase